jgi:hypothetical protein
MGPSLEGWMYIGRSHVCYIDTVLFRCCSVATGSKVMAAASEGIKRVTLELGGV